MALFDDVLKGWVPSALIGVGVALAAPIVLPALAAGARPLVKTLIKGCLVVAEAGEQISDLVAEAQAERAAGATAAATAAEQPSQPYNQS
jgi:hypothetical protein